MSVKFSLSFVHYLISKLLNLWRRSWQCPVCTQSKTNVGNLEIYYLQHSKTGGKGREEGGQSCDTEPLT